MYRYSRSQPTTWEQIEDIFKGKTLADFDTLINEVGFKPLPNLKLGEPDAGTVWAQVHYRLSADSPDDYLVLIGVGSGFEVVLAPHLGDLLALLREVLPVISGSEQLSWRHDEVEKFEFAHLTADGWKTAVQRFSEAREEP